jgi:hypothetical protein
MVVRTHPTPFDLVVFHKKPVVSTIISSIYISGLLFFTDKLYFPVWPGFNQEVSQRTQGGDDMAG